MSDFSISSTGKWVTVEGHVVDAQPVEGRLLVAPGGPLTPDVQAAIQAAEVAAPAAAEPAAEETPAPTEEKPSTEGKRGR